MADETSRPKITMGATRARSSGLELYTAFACVVLAFLSSTVFAQRSEAEIDRAARAIASNATASIERLAAARSALRRFARDVDDLAVSARGAPRREELSRARRLLDGELEAYAAIPFFAGEQGLWLDARAHLADVDELTRRLLDATELGRRDEVEPLRRELGAAVDRASERISALVGFNAGEAHRLAVDIERMHRRSVTIELALDSACVLFAVGAAVVIRRAARARDALAEAHTELVERRGEELEQFASRVAHDVLGPLGATRLAVDAALRRVEDERARSQLERGRAGLERTTRIVNELLGFARAGARPEPGASCDVRAVVDDVLGELGPDAEAAGARLERELGAELPRAACGAGVLTSVVSNLVRNAIKYLGERATRRVVVRASSAPGVVALEVEDTGPGLPPALGERAFEPYVRGPGARDAGLGLGLATVKKLVESHGGRVSVREAPGGGAAFRVELPVARSPSVTPPANPGAPGSPA